jgi:hypothetical protein
MGMMLAAEPAEDDIMQRPPRRPGKRLLGKLVLWLAPGPREFADWACWLGGVAWESERGLYDGPTWSAGA